MQEMVRIISRNAITGSFSSNSLTAYLIEAFLNDDVHPVDKVD